MKDDLALSLDEFRRRYIDPAMARLAHNGLCHPERLTAEDRAIWTNAPTVAELHCDGDCAKFIQEANGG